MCYQFITSGGVVTKGWSFDNNPILPPPEIIPWVGHFGVPVNMNITVPMIIHGYKPTPELIKILCRGAYSRAEKNTIKWVIEEVIRELRSWNHDALLTYYQENRVPIAIESITYKEGNQIYTQERYEWIYLTLEPEIEIKKFLPESDSRKVLSTKYLYSNETDAAIITKYVDEAITYFHFYADYLQDKLSQDYDWNGWIN